MYIVRGSGLDAFLAYELDQSPMNMPEITKIISEMGLVEYPQKIIVLNNYSEKVGLEYKFNLDWGKYSRQTLDDEDIMPKRKRQPIQKNKA